MSRDIDKRFKKFHGDNPGVYAELVRLVRYGKSKGRKKMGMKMVYEVARWNKFIQTTGDSWKLSNDFHSRYARLIMTQEADLKGIFDLRELRSENGESDDVDMDKWLAENFG